jgi:serine-type D-Ala-D-Ala endopeptidase (penicillin-binding protein 7)
MRLPTIFLRASVVGAVALMAVLGLGHATAQESGKPVVTKAAAQPKAKKPVTRSSKVSYVLRRDANGKLVRVAARRAVAAAPVRPSYGMLAGLHQQADLLDLKSSVALVVDQETKEVLFNKNADAVLPIASLTKLMTGLLVVEANLDLTEMVAITHEDVDTEKGSSSRLKVGTRLSRGELLHLALMSSENRAAHALGRTYPGGLPVFVARMNDKARQLGMSETRYVEPTGLSSRNQSSAKDLALLTDVASQVPLLRELSTSPGHQVYVGNRRMQYNNTNRLTLNPMWDIGVQKTGYISEAGQCLVMQARVAGRKLIMVFLDSAGKLSRLGDAERVRRWVESRHPITTGELELSPGVPRG